MVVVASEKIVQVTAWLFKSPLRILTFLVAVVGIAFASLFSIITNSVHETNRATALENSANTSKLINKIIQEHFEGLINFVESYANRQRFRVLLEEGRFNEASPHLQEMVTNNKFIYLSFFSSPGGDTVLLYPPDPGVVGKNFAFREWYKSVSMKNRTIVSEIYRTAVTPYHLVVAVSTPVRNNSGKLIGYLSTLSSLQSMADWATSYRPSQNGSVLLLDHAGNLVVKPDGMQSPIKNIASNSTVSEALSGKSGVVEAPDPVTGASSLIAYSSVEGFNWRILVTQPLSAVYAQVNSLYNALFLIACIFGAVIVLWSFYWLNSVRSFAMKQQKALKAITASEDKFKHIFESDMLGMFFWGADGKVAECNNVILAMLGYSQEDLAAGKINWMAMTPPEFAPLDQEAINQVIAVGVCKPYEKEYIKKNGSRLPILIGATKLEVAGLKGLCFVLDMSDKKRSDLALRASEFANRNLAFRLQTVINHSPISLTSFDSNGIYTFCDGQALRRFGLKPGELVGQSIYERHKGNPELTGAMDRALKGESTSGELKMGDCWLLTHSTPVFDENGVVTSVVALSIDITERKLAEEKAKETELRQQETLTKSNMKSTFLANMSHEIRTPINGVIGMTSLLADTKLTPDQAGFVEGIQRSGEQLLTVINDILDFSKIESGKLDFEEINFDVRQTVDDVVQSMGLAAQKKGLQIVSHMEDSLSRFALGDPGRLRQVLANLLNNAIKFTPNGLVLLRVKGTRSGDIHCEYRFEIEDRGIGISKENQSKLFQAFTQADAATNRKFGGTGLGLSICKHLVEKMNGEIGVDSEEGKGSTFWFTVQMKQGVATLPSTAKESDLSIPDELRSIRVLVAEDNAINQTIALRMLAKMGLKADAVASGTEVLSALQNIPYGLIIMDCQMPVMDGFDATRAIRGGKIPNKHDIPIIAMTANALKGDRERCLEAGMDDYVSKPVHVRDLTVVVLKWLAIAKNRGPLKKTA